MSNKFELTNDNIKKILAKITARYNYDYILQLLFLDEIKSVKKKELTADIPLISKFKEVVDCKDEFMKFVFRDDNNKFLDKDMIIMALNATMYKLYHIDSTEHECCRGFLTVKMLDRFIEKNDTYRIIIPTMYIKEKADLIESMGYMKKYILYIQNNLFEEILFDNIVSFHHDSSDATEGSNTEIYSENNITADEEEEVDPNEGIDYKYVPYEEKENNNESGEVSIEEMQNELKSKNVAIIGGHINWLNKMKRLFDQWVYVDNPREDPKKKIMNCEAIYFFTDHLDHVIYEKYIAAARNMSSIKIGYIHNVNIDQNVKQIYDEICQ